jgi:predicted metalloprotease with PDZ domain
MLPSWIPGSYLLREFARQVVAIRAEAAGRPIALEQSAKGTWLAVDAARPLVVTLTVHAFDLSVRGAYFDHERAFFNGTSLFLLVEGRDAEPVELMLRRPAHPVTAGWRVASAMRARDVDAEGFGTYVADNYDELIDHPFEIGSHAAVEFVAAGVPHRFVIAGRFDTDPERLAADLSQLCTAQIDFFGRPAPFDHYSFLGLAVGDGYGGLEHRASSSLIFKRDNLPRPGEPGIPADYQGFLALCSHEYFHSWHIKRSKPAAFMPYRLDRRNHTRPLWVFEGITSYYQELFLLRSGLLGSAAFLRRIGELLTRVYRVPGRQRQSLAESSFNAWDRLYKPDANSVNTGVSYYSKGAMIALALDLMLRRGGAATLDDIVRALWLRFGQPGIGLPEDGFEDLAAEYGGDSVRAFLTGAIEGTDDPDLPALLDAFGLRLKFRQVEGAQDRGGTPPSATAPRLGIGAAWQAHGAGLKLTQVPDGQPAQAAGLAPDDVIVALDRIQANYATLTTRLSRYEAGDAIPVSYFRGDELRETELVLEALPSDSCYIEIVADADEGSIELRRAWLGE